jgi:serine/threonine protein kinase
MIRKCSTFNLCIPKFQRRFFYFTQQTARKAYENAIPRHGAYDLVIDWEATSRHYRPHFQGQISRPQQARKRSLRYSLPSQVDSHLKIIVAEASTHASELDIVRHVKENQTTGASPGSEYVMEIFDEFQVLLEGLNGLHQCIVSELLGSNIQQPDLEEIFLEDCFPTGMAKKMCAQIVQGLAHLHRCKVVHSSFSRICIVIAHPRSHVVQIFTFRTSSCACPE